MLAPSLFVTVSYNSTVTTAVLDSSSGHGRASCGVRLTREYFLFPASIVSISGHSKQLVQSSPSTVTFILLNTAPFSVL